MIMRVSRKPFAGLVKLLKTFARTEQNIAGRQILIEDFIPGVEVALEGLLTKNTLHALALFDKPDPLDGPYFEETIYVTPSRLSSNTQTRIVPSLWQKAARAIGLQEGPVHGELRINDQDIWVIEVAARSIGGKCSRMLEFGTGQVFGGTYPAPRSWAGTTFLGSHKESRGRDDDPDTPRRDVLERIEGQG